MRKLAFISAVALAAAVSGCSNNNASTAAEDPKGCQPNCGGTQSAAPSEAASDQAK
ncbi:MAG: hypothetical protein ACKOPO_10865 [Novosphingobium sp.]